MVLNSRYVRFTQGNGMSKGLNDSGRITVLREGASENMNHGDFTRVDDTGEANKELVVVMLIGNIP